MTPLFCSLRNSWNFSPICAYTGLYVSQWKGVEKMMFSQAFVDLDDWLFADQDGGPSDR